MMKDHKKITVMEAIDYLVEPSQEERDIIEEGITQMGIPSFLLSLQHYDLSEPVTKKLMDLKNVVEVFVDGMATEKGEGGEKSGQENRMRRSLL